MPSGRAACAGAGFSPSRLTATAGFGSRVRLAGLAPSLASGLAPSPGSPHAPRPVDAARPALPRHPAWVPARRRQRAASAQDAQPAHPRRPPPAAAACRMPPPVPASREPHPASACLRPGPARYLPPRRMPPAHRPTPTWSCSARAGSSPASARPPWTGLAAICGRLSNRSRTAGPASCRHCSPAPGRRRSASRQARMQEATDTWTLTAFPYLPPRPPRSHTAPCTHPPAQSWRKTSMRECMPPCYLPTLPPPSVFGLIR